MRLVPDLTSLVIIRAWTTPAVEAATAVMVYTCDVTLLRICKTGTRVRLAANELNAPMAAIYAEDGKQLFKVSAKDE